MRLESGERWRGNHMVEKILYYRLGIMTREENLIMSSNYYKKKKKTPIDYFSFIFSSSLDLCKIFNLDFKSAIILTYRWKAKIRFECRVPTYLPTSYQATFFFCFRFTRLSVNVDRHQIYFKRVEMCIF